MANNNKTRKVILQSFLGTLKPKGSINLRENYWQLIGESGSIILEDLKEKKVLIRFDKNLDDLNLENHNPIKNTLWIRISDLKF